jgi:hypothetical protein
MNGDEYTEQGKKGTKMEGNVKKQKPYLCMNIDMAF